MKILNDNLGTINVPDFILVGAAKGATTSLHHYMSEHPEIQMPEIKETWFFSFMNNPPKYSSPGVLSSVVSDLEEYSGLFEGVGSGLKIGDASPSYLYTHEDVIRNIRDVYPEDKLSDLRIIISLREPGARAFSQYWTFKRRDEEPLSFEEAIDPKVISQRMEDNWNIFYDYTGFSRYHDQVKAYVDAFGKDRVQILLYDDIQDNPLEACRKIFSFIGVDENFEPSVSVKHNSLTGEARLKFVIRMLTSENPIKRKFAALIPEKVKNKIRYSVAKILLKRDVMSLDTRQKLSTLYLPEINRLEKLINRDLEAWKSSR